MNFRIRTLTTKLRAVNIVYTLNESNIQISNNTIIQNLKI